MPRFSIPDTSGEAVKVVQRCFKKYGRLLHGGQNTRISSHYSYVLEMR
jgi:hypothetical protein